ncbi:nucleotidyltransferase domain protein [Clostridium tepidiprofundi DSM 19306]|uniref:Nucleotidyltransferase domain protein n=1 Tax=Clostridium tepidiprofundi DSM 19306 TaxID=1121338 RepID=A0A151AZ77_9CLOT|nr:nucleotidyltransferase domain-containing protein [Clostridium tepidiprofundi]KYH32852.1 nucleotidyltransferase domain protein [Clostridium tepidiprofundi DSM 19306]
MTKKPISKSDIVLEKFDNIIGICTFGSYNEECWDKNRSDIDVMILLNRELDWKKEIEIEEYLDSKLPNYFEHDNIHYTFINEFVYPFSEIFICSNDKIIIREEEYLDYILGYSVFKRDREYLEIIREENLKSKELVRNGLL